MYDCMHYFILIIMNGVYILCVDYISRICCSVHSWGYLAVHVVYVLIVYSHCWGYHTYCPLNGHEKTKETSKLI